MLTSLIVLCPWIPVLLKFSPISYLDFMHDQALIYMIQFKLKGGHVRFHYPALY